MYTIILHLKQRFLSLTEPCQSSLLFIFLNNPRSISLRCCEGGKKRCVNTIQHQSIVTSSDNMKGLRKSCYLVVNFLLQKLDIFNLHMIFACRFGEVVINACVEIPGVIRVIDSFAGMSHRRGANTIFGEVEFASTTIILMPISKSISFSGIYG